MHVVHSTAGDDMQNELSSSNYKGSELETKKFENQKNSMKQIKWTLKGDA